MPMHLALASRQILPPICPSCGAAGVHAHDVDQADTARASTPLCAYYCDLCHEQRVGFATKRYSLVLSLGVMTFATASGVALLFGTRAQPMQLAIMTLVGGLSLFVLRRFAIGPSPDVRESPPREGHRTVVLTSGPLSSSLVEGGARVLEGQRSPKSIEPITIVPMALGLIWWGALQLGGGTSLRFIHGGDSATTVLVDSRKVASIAPTRFEDPRAGGFIRVLGGMRTIQLYDEAGQLIAEDRVALWPGRRYVAGTLPRGQCLFLQSVHFGESPTQNWQVIEGNAPLWEVPSRVDSWFESPPTNEESERNVPASGGTRHAVRLLPCNGPSSSPAAETHIP